MSLHRQSRSKGWLRGFGVGVVVAAVLGIGGWLYVEASDSQGRPALPERQVAAASSPAAVQLNSHDPLVIAMDNWEQTKGKNKKSKKNHHNSAFFPFGDDYYNNYLFYYMLFYNNYHGDHVGYNNNFPIYFNYFWFNDF